MHNIFILVLLVMFSLFGQTNNILILRPNESKFKKMEFGIKTEIMNKMAIRTLVTPNEADIMNALGTALPKIVIVMDMKLIRLWKKIQQKNQEINLIPSIMLGCDFFDIKDNMSNSCIVTYETKLEHYIDRIIHFTGKNPGISG